MTERLMQDRPLLGGNSADNIYLIGVDNARLSVLPPGLPIAELAAVLRRCRLHVGGDSGVLHLAVALGMKACLAGYGVYYISGHELARRLVAGHQPHGLAK